MNKLPIIDINDSDIIALYKIIGANVKKARLAKGITQLDLALALGYKSVSSIAKAESLIESKHFNIAQLYKISKALDIDLGTLFTTDKNVF